MRIEILTPDAAEAAIPALAVLLRDVVHAGASVNFVLPFDVAQAEAWWRGRIPAWRAGALTLFALHEGEALAGCVMLDCGTPPNQPHRAEATKLLVHPSARRRGHGRALMMALEAGARARGRSLVTLDTRTGDAAELLYAGLGYLRVGEIPGFCVDPLDPGKIDGTTIMYKRLD